MKKEDGAFRTACKGFSLVSVLLGLALTAIGAILIMRVANSQQNALIQAEVLVAKQLLRLRIEKNIVDYQALSHTKEQAENADFNACFPTTNNTTTSCDTSKKSVYLYNASNEKITGIQTDPLYYKNSGELCSGAAADCPFQVYSEFRASCKTGSTCNRSTSLEVKYIIEENPLHYGDGKIKIRSSESPYLPIGSLPRFIMLEPKTKVLPDQFRFYRGNDGGSSYGTPVEFGKHQGCFLNGAQYDGDPCGNCVLQGTRGSSWQMIICDEGDAHIQGCWASCLDLSF